MLKRKENKVKNNTSKKSQLIVGSLLIIMGISLVGGKLYYNYYFDHKDDDKVQEFYEEQEKIIDNTQTPDITDIAEQEVKKDVVVNVEDYIAVIKIPKIGVEKGLYSKDSKNNNVSRNIQIIKESSYPDVDGGNFILAAHSGNSRVSYFRKLDKLQGDDEVSIFYGGSEYKYKVVNIYDIEKTGSANIVRNANKTTLTLITCRHNTNKQIVVICELVEIV
ncbi:MAG: sortase [Bacilli bacterium]